MLRTILPLAVLCLAAATAPAADDPAGKFLVYLGTYTSAKGSEGIYRAELDLATGKLTAPTLAVKTVNPTFLALDPTGKYLYAVNETDNYPGKKGTGSVSAFAIDPKTGDLTLLNRQSSEGAGPCHLVVAPSGKNVLVANYGGATCKGIVSALAFIECLRELGFIAPCAGEVRKERLPSSSGAALIEWTTFARIVYFSTRSRIFAVQRRDREIPGPE